MTANTTVYTPGAFSQTLLSIIDRYEWLNDTLASQITSAIELRITSSQIVLSFDVFDTLLLRNHRSELRRFYDVSGIVADALSQRYAQKINANDVLMARLLANRLSYRLSPMLEGCREGTITDIYRVILKQVGIEPTESDIEMCVDIELRYEVTQLTVNQPLIDLIRRHIQNHGRAIYISDMYLSSVHINKLLTLVGVDVSLFAATYSSADTVVSKRSGKIWPMILRDLAITSNELLHVGDSLVSDYQSPRQLGIDAVHLPLPLQMRRDIMADYGAMVHQLESVHLPIQGWMAPPHW